MSPYHHPGEQALPVHHVPISTVNALGFFWRNFHSSPHGPPPVSAGEEMKGSRGHCPKVTPRGHTFLACITLLLRSLYPGTARQLLRPRPTSGSLFQPISSGVLFLYHYIRKSSCVAFDFLAEKDLQVRNQNPVGVESKV